MKILIAEDDAVSHRLLESLLIKWNYEVVSCSDGREALGMLQHEDSPPIAILDWMMPEIDGIKVCREVRKLNKDRYTYILLLTAKGQNEDIVDGLKAGADDYIIKPFNSHELEMRIRAGRRIIELEEKLRDLSFKDSLTGIYNRRGFFTLSEHQLKMAGRQQKTVLLLFADIDNLKEINDIYGHKEGDSALIETAGILKETYRKSDIIARVGGDEFAVFFMGSSENDAEAIMGRLQNKIETYNMKHGKYKLSISFGISSFNPESVHNIEHILYQADKLMYVHKKHKQKH
jgi:diguanylate cyclase (GGDEF)-like protein